MKKIITILLLLPLSLAFSQITIDGDMSDWDNVQQFDVEPNLPEEAGDFPLKAWLDIVNVYVTHNDSMLYVMVTFDDSDGTLTDSLGQIDADGWTEMVHLYFDTDLNEATGYQDGNGGDFDLDITNIHGQFDSGDPAEFTVQQWGVRKSIGDWSFEEIMGDSALCAIDAEYGTSIEVGIPRHLLGLNYGDFDVLSLIVKAETPSAWGTNDFALHSSTNDPANSEYARSLYRFSDLGEGDLPIPSDKPITIDGDMSDWTDAMLLTTSPNAEEPNDDFPLMTWMDIQDVYVTHDDKLLYIRVDFSDADGTYADSIGTVYSDGWKDMVHIYFDTDMNSANGYIDGGGGDFDLDISNPYGQDQSGDPAEQTVQQFGVRKYVGDWAFEEVMGDSCQVAIDTDYGTSIEVAIPRHLISETRGEYESTQIFIKAETPTAWGTNDLAPNLTREQRLGNIRQTVYNYGRGHGDLTTSIKEDNLVSGIPSEYKISQNYPNPFNPTTNIKFSIPESGLVTVKVFNILGQEVTTLVNKEMSTGSYKVDFNASNLTSGMYIYKISAGKFSAAKKMLLLK